MPIARSGGTPDFIRRGHRERRGVHQRLGWGNEETSGEVRSGGAMASRGDTRGPGFRWGVLAAAARGIARLGWGLGLEVA
jgi:hypothetical protein